MQILGHEVSESLATLLLETNSLSPDRPVQFEAVDRSDPRLMRGAKAQATQEHDGSALVLVNEYTEYALAHELMHVWLTRMGYPKANAVLHELDRWATDFATSIEDLVIHPTLNRLLSQRGIDPAPYYREFMDGFREWPTPEVTDMPRALMRAFTVASAILMGGPWDKETRELCKTLCPKALALSRQLVRPMLTLEKAPVTLKKYRDAMVGIMRVARDICLHEIGEDPKLVHRICFTLVLPEQAMGTSAKDHFFIDSGNRLINGRQACFIGFKYRADGTFLESLVADGVLGVDDATPYDRRVNSLTVRDFLDTVGLRYAVDRVLPY